MASTFTTNTGLEKIGDGEQTSLWGQTTNLNFDIIDRALNGVVPITLTGTSFTLTTSSGSVSDGQAAAVVFSGSPGGPATVTVAPNTAQKTYIIRNATNQPLTVTQGSGGSVTLVAGSAAVLVCTGGGASAGVFQAGGGTAVDLTTDVSGILPIANGGTGSSSTQFVNLATNVSNALPVANGGTGRQTLSSGAIVLGAGSGQVGLLVGSSVGQVPQWTGTTWSVGSLPGGGVTNVTASAPLASSGGSAPNISFTGPLAITLGGTGSTTQSGARTNLGLGTIATQNSNNVSITGGTVLGRSSFGTMAGQNSNAVSITGGSIGSGVSITLSAAAVGAATAGLGAGAVGTYAWLYDTPGTNQTPGATRAGSSLRYAGEWGSFSGGNTGGQFISSPLPAGTWRCMGYSKGDSFAGATLWLRIS